MEREIQKIENILEENNLEEKFSEDTLRGIDNFVRTARIISSGADILPNKGDERPLVAVIQFHGAMGYDILVKMGKKGAIPEILKPDIGGQVRYNAEVENALVKSFGLDTMNFVYGWQPKQDGIRVVRAIPDGDYVEDKIFKMDDLASARDMFFSDRAYKYYVYLPGTKNEEMPVRKQDLWGEVNACAEQAVNFLRETGQSDRLTMMMTGYPLDGLFTILLQKKLGKNELNLPVVYCTHSIAFGEEGKEQDILGGTVRQHKGLDESIVKTVVPWARDNTKIRSDLALSEDFHAEMRTMLAGIRAGLEQGQDVAALTTQREAMLERARAFLLGDEPAREAWAPSIRGETREVPAELPALKVSALLGREHMYFRHLAERIVTNTATVVAYTAPAHVNPEKGYTDISDNRVVESIPGVNRSSFRPMEDLISGSPLHDRFLAGDEKTRIFMAERYLEKEWDIEPGHKIVYIASRLEPEKGIDLAVEAIGELGKTLPNVTLLVTAGDAAGAYADKIKALAAERNVDLRLHPFTDQNGYLQAAVGALGGTFVLASRREPFGMTPLEAGATRAPVIASKFAGCTDTYLRNDRDVLVVDPFNKEEFATALYRMLTDEKLRQRLVKNNADKAKKATWTNNVLTAMNGALGAIEAVLTDKEPTISPENKPFEHAALNVIQGSTAPQDINTMRLHGLVEAVNEHTPVIPEGTSVLTEEETVFLQEHREELTPEQLAILQAAKVRGMETS